MKCGACCGPVLKGAQLAELEAKARRAGMPDDLTAAAWAAIQAWKPEPAVVDAEADESPSGRKRVFVKG